MDNVGADCHPEPGRAVYLRVSAVMAVLTGLALWGSINGGTTGAVLVLDIVVAAASVVAAPVLIRQPVWVALAFGALAALSPTATAAASVGALVTARSRPLRTAVFVGAVGVAGQAIQGGWRPVGGLSYAWWLLLMAVAYAGIVAWGALWQSQAERVNALRERARRAEADQDRRVLEARQAERTRMAREMHDVLAHRLSLVATYAGALEYRPDASPEQIAKAAGVVRSGVHQALDELRQVITVLRDGEPKLDQPAPALADVPSLVDESRQAGTHVTLDFRIRDIDLEPSSSGRAAYRIVQEGLTNARKHAVGQPVSVRVDGQPGQRLSIEVTNQVRAGSGAAAPGVGLVGLAERVALAGGQIDHRISDSGEFHLRAWLPWSI